jgi:hypothetical protein
VDVGSMYTVSVHFLSAIYLFCPKLSFLSLPTDMLQVSLTSENVHTCILQWKNSKSIRGDMCPQLCSICSVGLPPWFSSPVFIRVVYVNKRICVAQPQATPIRNNSLIFARHHFVTCTYMPLKHRSSFSANIINSIKNLLHMFTYTVTSWIRRKRA